MNSQLVQDLEATRALLDDPASWGKGYSALENPAAPGGFTYCLLGAVDKAIIGNQDALTGSLLGRFDRAAGALGRTVNTTSLVRFNDDVNTTHARVLAVIDATIARELAE